MAPKREKRWHTPRVLRRKDDIVLVLEHPDSTHRLKYQDGLQVFERPHPEDKVTEPQFSLTSKGFAFYERIEVRESAGSEPRVDSYTSSVWRQYRLRVEF